MLRNFPPSEIRGRRECRVRAAPAVSCAMCTRRCAHEHTGSAEAIRHSLRNGFTAYNALSPVIGLSCHRHFRRYFRKSLTPASRRQDHTSSPYAYTPFVTGASASTATRPNVRDDGQRPSWRDGMAGVVGVIWVYREAEYFCDRGWTGQISLKLLQKIAQSRSMAHPCGDLRLDAVECAVTAIAPLTMGSGPPSQ